jgi:hypothetical protein
LHPLSSGLSLPIAAGSTSTIVTWGSRASTFRVSWLLGSSGV